MYRRHPPGRTRRMLYSREFQEALPTDDTTAEGDLGIPTQEDMYNEHNRYVNYLESVSTDDYSLLNRFRTSVYFENILDSNGEVRPLLPRMNVADDDEMPPLIPNVHFENISDTDEIRPSLPRLYTAGLRELYGQTTIDMPELDIDDILQRMDTEFSYENLSLLEDVKVGLISERILNNTKIRNSEDVGFCIICQEDIFLCIERVLGCNHNFHVDCIDKWLSSNNKCPTCRVDV